jgi:hypothetical protein
MMGTLILISFLVLVLNVPFGYWRKNVARFSLQWFLSIHIPVPVIVVLRLTTGIGFAWYTYVVMVSAFFLGQQAGSLILQPVHTRCHQDSSCLIMDLYRCFAAPGPS